MIDIEGRKLLPLEKFFICNKNIIANEEADLGKGTVKEHTSSHPSTPKLDPGGDSTSATFLVENDKSERNYFGTYCLVFLFIVSKLVSQWTQACKYIK